MSIHTQIKRFSELEDCDVYIGNGPKHPTNPNIKLTEIVEAYFKRFPFLLWDAAYVEFMECYAGAYLFQPKPELAVDIFGFAQVSSDIEKSGEDFLWQGESNIIVADDYLVFCDASLLKSNDVAVRGDAIPQTQGTGFVFDASGTRKKGIYKAVVGRSERIDYSWYCDSFSHWLNILIETSGRFPERLVED